MGICLGGADFNGRGLRAGGKGGGIPGGASSGSLLLLLILLFKLSKVVSVLSMKNQELAMQVSLLNNDYEKIIKELEKLEKEK